MHQKTQNILNRFSTHYKQTLVRAYHASIEQKKKEIEVADIFWSILEEKGSLAFEALTKAGMKQAAAQNEPGRLNAMSLDEILRQKKDAVLSADARQIIAASLGLAQKREHTYVGTEHLLHSILSRPPAPVKQALADNKINAEEMLKNLEVIFGSTSKFSEMTGAVESIKEKIKKDKTGRANLRESLLDIFSLNLTSAEVQKDIHPVIGREPEIERIIQILCRKTKNNPVLLGEPGVGKTAIIEGLAKNIISGDVPDVLLNKKIYSLDMPLLVAGTTYRGEFEARIKQIIDEVKDDPDVILFIDEIHNIIGAGSAPGSMDAANILKPALARGEIRCIGATTYDDYKKSIEPDSALARRLQRVDVLEPSEAQTIEILKGVRRNYERHHWVIISDEALIEAVRLSSRYLTDQFLPDKALDLIDEAASRKRVSQPRNANLKKIAELENELAQTITQKNKLVAEEKYKEALQQKTGELTIITKICALEENELKRRMSDANAAANAEVQAADIRALVKSMTKIDLPDSGSTSRYAFKTLEDELKKRVIGQTKALAEIVNALKRSAAGLSSADRPLGSFIFAGPSGTGKTYTAKILSELLVPGKDNLIRLDMSEFAEKFNASKLIGAPAGYVGYGEGGQLTEQVKRKPYAVILLDEIEKAHPDIFDLFLQVIEDGYLSDAKGKKINFRNTIIVLTTNVGIKKRGAGAKLGFAGQDNDREDGFKDALAEFMRPEFLNRLDKIIIFNRLNQKNLEKIIQLELTKTAARVKERGFELTYGREVIKYLLKKIDGDELGARKIRELIRDEIENKLADKILAGTAGQPTLAIKHRAGAGLSIA